MRYFARLQYDGPSDGVAAASSFKSLGYLVTDLGGDWIHVEIDSPSDVDSQSFDAAAFGNGSREPSDIEIFEVK